MSWKFANGLYAWSNDSRSNNSGSNNSGATGVLSCQVSEADPMSGVGGWTRSDESLEMKLFQVHGFAVGKTDDGDWTNRQNDLSVALAYNAERPTGVECYWCGSDDPSGAFSLELWVSASTRLLDEQILCHCDSSAAVTQVQLLHIDANGCIENSRELDAGEYHFSYRNSGVSQTAENQVDQERAFLCGLANSDYQLLLAGYPCDQNEIKLELEDGQLKIQQHLKFGFLEKGVIRRTRLLAVLLPAVPALTTEVEQRLQSFYQSPLPLTV